MVYAGLVIIAMMKMFVHGMVRIPRVCAVILAYSIKKIAETFDRIYVYGVLFKSQVVYGLIPNIKERRNFYELQ